MFHSIDEMAGRTASRTLGLFGLDNGKVKRWPGLEPARPASTII